MVNMKVLAILALHDMCIIHHDVKPSNILIGGDGHCVLTDYGGSLFTTPASLTGSGPSIHSSPASVASSSSSRLHPSMNPLAPSTHASNWNAHKEQIPIFTARYAAPEVLRIGGGSTSSHSSVKSSGDTEPRKYGTAVDFWSLGVTLFELATRQVSQ